MSKTVVVTCCGAVILPDIECSHMECRGWITLPPCEHDEFIQVVPMNDTHEHQRIGRKCWCEPALTRVPNPEAPVIVLHRAKDGRMGWEDRIRRERRQQLPAFPPMVERRGYRLRPWDVHD